MNTQIDLSKLCGRKVSDEEAARIREVANNLELRDDDAIWQLLAAIEYQKTYYEKIPGRIENASDKLLENIKKSAEKEVEKSQAILAQSVVKHASELSLSMKLEVITPLVLAGIIIQFCYGIVMLWAGIKMATTGFYPLTNMLRLEIWPILMGMIGILGSIFAIIGLYAAFGEKYRCDRKGDYKFLLNYVLAIACFCIAYHIYCEIFP